MLSRDQTDAIITAQMGYAERRRNHANYVWEDEPELRAAWLKQLFLSFDYHELLINIHYVWMNYIKEAIARPYVKEKHPSTYQFFVSRAIPNFEFVAKPGQLDPKKWEPGKQSGFANTIGYYDRGTGLDMEYNWTWMTKEDAHFLGPLGGYMQEMCKNIQTTVNQGWKDDAIIRELNTGPIDWPANWKDALTPEQVTSSTSSSSAVQQPSVAAGKPVPRSGWWFTPARLSSRHHFQQGDTFPEIEGSTYGGTFWQWSPDQSAPKL